ARLRHGRGAAAAPDRGRGLARVPAPAPGGGQAMTATDSTTDTATREGHGGTGAPPRRHRSGKGPRERGSTIGSTVVLRRIGAPPRRHRSGKGPRERGSTIASTVVMLVIGGAFLIPLLWVVLASFNTEASLSIAWPSSWSLGNFSAIWNAETTFRPLLNSLILCGGATVVTMTTAVLCAYPMSRYRFRAKRPLLLGIIFSTGLPITAIMIPVYSLFVQVNLIDSMGGAILFLGASSLPYAIFLTKGFMDGVPVEIEESAWTEG